MWRRVHSATNLANATLARDALIAEGIDARIRGEGRASAAGEIPLPEAMIEVVVPGDSYLRAVGVLTRLEEAEEGEPWRCPRCGEEVPGSFEVCWKCGADRLS